MATLKIGDVIEVGDDCGVTTRELARSARGTRAMTTLKIPGEVLDLAVQNRT
jgi:hypothetical protein